MIQPLRRYHLWIWVAIGLLLIALHAVSLVWRRSNTPRNPGLVWERVK